MIVHGISLPDSDTHFREMIERSPLVDNLGTYQLNKYVASKLYIRPEMRTAIDVGAHVGLWTRVMARDFQRVVAIEPAPMHLEHLRVNVGHLSRVSIQPWAAAAGFGELRITEVEGNSGNAHISRDGVAVRSMPIDHLELSDVDLIKIDVEGYETQVLMGAHDTIRACRPAVIIEQKPGNAERYGGTQREALALLLSWGGRHKWELSGDHLVVF